MVVSVEKKELSVNTSMFPAPAVLVSCSLDGQDNIITLAWASKMCMHPPKMAIAINQERHSYRMVKGSGEFVINLPTVDQAYEVDYCGTRSGRDLDKFDELKLTKVPGSKVKAPLIGECPVNIECKVTESMLVGSHEIFVGEVVAYWADETYRTDKGFDYEKLKPLVYISPGYWSAGEKKAFHGYSKK
jgi:flavin reductase (DIM6/NTAB) family NADH-FMN oxidoreductase RutF